MRTIGAMRERLVIQRFDPPSLAVSSLTRSGSTATVTTQEPHDFHTGDQVRHASADQAEYNVKARVTVTSPKSYTFPVSGSPATPATGAVTATYASDALRGMDKHWRTLDTVPAKLVPLRGSKQLQAGAVQGQTSLRFETRTRDDVTAQMRLRWTPSWLNGPAKSLVMAAPPMPIDDGRQWMAIDVVVQP
jgi:head-tail adaptor